MAVLSTGRNDRRVHLETLRAAVEARREMVCEVVVQRGAVWVNVVGPSRAWAQVGCDYLRSGWWFTWADGQPIAPVGDVQGAVARIAKALGDGSAAG